MKAKTKGQSNIKTSARYLAAAAVLVWCLLFSLPARSAAAAEPVASGTYGANVTWELTGTEGAYTLTIRGQGAMRDAEHVSGADANTPWETYKSGITTVVVEEGVTRIGNFAFYSCSNLTTIKLPESVTSIGRRVFDDCKNLTTIELPASVTSIGEGAFGGCDSLTTIELPAGVTSVEMNTFFNCVSLTKIELPAGVTRIGNYAFGNCRRLTTIELPAGVTSIGEKVFSYCSNLTTIEIPASVTSIESNAFQDSEVTTFVLPHTWLVDWPAGVAEAVFAVNEATITYSGHVGRGYYFKDEETLDVLLEVCKGKQEDYEDWVWEWCLAEEDGGYAVAGSAQISCADVCYDGKPHGATVKTTGSMAGTQISYYTKQGDTAQLTTAPTGVGEYTAYVTKENVEYYDGVKESDQYVTISKAFKITQRALEVYIAEQKVEYRPDGDYSSVITLRFDNLPAGVTFEKGKDYTITKAKAPENHLPGQQVSLIVEITLLGDNATNYKLGMGGGFDIYPEASCGATSADTVTWTLENNNTRLILSGTGKMKDFASAKDVPWANFKDGISEVSFASGSNITHIGAYAFANFNGLNNSDFTVPESVTSIGTQAFANNMFTLFTLPTDTITIANDAFSGCSIDRVCKPCTLTYAFAGAAVSNETIDHDWRCEVTGGNQLTVSCTKCTTVKGTATLACAGGTYKGSAYEATLTLTDGLQGMNQEPAISYQKRWSDGYVEDLDDAPEDAGSYTATVSVSTGVTDSYNVKLSVDYTIKQLALSVFCPPVSGVDYQSNGDYSMFVTVNFGELGDATPTQGQNGDYKVTVTLNDSNKIGGTMQTSVKISLTERGKNNYSFYGYDSYNTAISITTKPLSGNCGADGQTADVQWTLRTMEEDGSSAYKLTISGSGTMADYTSAAGVPWSEYQSQITTVVVEDGVKNVGAYAFANCDNLTTVTLETVKTIGDGAFSSTGLTTVTIPSEASIGTQAFSGCSGLSSVTLEQGVVLAADAFSGCTALTSVTKSCDVSYDFSAFNGNAVVTLTHDSGYTYSNENGVLQEICGNQTCEQVVGTATLRCTASIIPYDGKTHEASLTFTGTLQPASGSEAGGIASERTVFYREKDTLTELSGAPAEVGSYTAYANIPVSDTKNSPQTICVDFEIKDMITAEATSPATASWQTSALISAPAGYEISTTKDGTYQATISVTDSSTSTTGTVVTYYLKETATGAFSGKKTITVLVDATAPEITGGTVTERTASAAKVQFAVTDALSGVTDCRYLLKPSAETAPTVEEVLGTQGTGAEGTGTGTGAEGTGTGTGAESTGTGTGAEGTDTQSAGAQGTAATSTQMAGAEPVVLENLEANTAYTLYVAAKDAAGNTTLSSIAFVTKCAGITENVTKNHYYGTTGTGSIDLSVVISAYRPKCKNPTYAWNESSLTGNVVSKSSISVAKNGIVSYTTQVGSENDTGSFVVVITADNYEPITVKVTITLTGKQPIHLAENSTVSLTNSSLTYGEPLSNLVFATDAAFVDTAGNSVSGTLQWKTPSSTPDASVTSAEWTFVPTQPEYQTAEGSVAITVTAATLTVSELPTTATLTYHPKKHLSDVALTGGKVVPAGTKATGTQAAGTGAIETGAAGTETTGTGATGTGATGTGATGTETTGTGATGTGAAGTKATGTETTGTQAVVSGTWSWESGSLIPTADNQGYMAVFTPTDTNKYQPVSASITVIVNKATPYIKETPTAELTYGTMLDKASLSGGAACYSSDETDEIVSGSFAWEESDSQKPSELKPTVADSNTTQYTVVFTPTDAVNYTTAATTITITVNKAAKPATMPQTTADVSYGTAKVKDVPLPDGWAWADADAEKALTVGTTVKATAVYAGADKGNYKNESVTVSITRSACEHTGGTATCKEQAKCSLCGEPYGELDLTKHTGGTATCKDKAVCTVCGKPYGELDLTKHTGGTATCKEQAVCTVCGKPYGELDATKHTGETEVRGKIEAKCTEAGYTGDTYCKDCNQLLVSGTTVNALEHIDENKDNICDRENCKATLTISPTTTPSPSEPTTTPSPSEPTPTPSPSEPTPTPSPSEPTLTPSPSEPTMTPSPSEPTPTPTMTPSPSEPTPTPSPSEPTPKPTLTPSPSEPTPKPTMTPSPSEPTTTPTLTPSPSEPTITPSPSEPTITPSPSEPTPTPSPSEPTQTPSPSEPTITPSPSKPTTTPSPSEPTITATPKPSEPTQTPSPSEPKPTQTPSPSEPTPKPTQTPSPSEPTPKPTVTPSPSEPTPKPTTKPSPSEPTITPTMTPSPSEPMTTPSPSEPTTTPSPSEPTTTPSSSEPTTTPSPSEPTTKPTMTPSPSEPTATPSPSEPTLTPSPSEPTAKPTLTPSPSEPTTTPSPSEPTMTPSPSEPTAKPTLTPSPSEPTMTPSPSEPTATPTPSSAPTKNPGMSYKPETEWASSDAFRDMENQYEVLLGTSAKTTSIIGTLNVGDTIDLNFYGVKNWTKGAYTYRWTSSDESVATVDNLGNVTMHSEGIAIIRLELVEKATGRKLSVAPMFVGTPESSYHVFLGTSAKDAKTVWELPLGSQIDLNFYGVKNWKKENYEYFWTSSDEDIATVNNKGVVTTKKSGTVLISLKIKEVKTGEYLKVAPAVITIPEKQ